MKRSLFVLFLISLWCNLAQCDEVYFRNGQILRNCHVADTSESKVHIVTSTGIRTFPLVVIDKIVTGSYDPKRPTIVQNQDGTMQTLDSAKVLTHEQIQAIINASPLPGELTSTTYPNIYLLPVSAIAFGLTYIEFKLQLESGDWKPEPTILGTTFLVAGIVNTVFALKTVEVRATSNSVGMIYHF
jgi:glutaredoxin